MPAVLPGWGSPTILKPITKIDSPQTNTLVNQKVAQAKVNEASRFAPSIDLQRPILVETGCDNAADVLACLRNTSADELIAAAKRVPRAGTSSNPFAPTISVYRARSGLPGAAEFLNRPIFLIEMIFLSITFPVPTARHKG